MRERMRELAEGRLVEAVAAGDDAAAAELYRRYHRVVRRHAQSIVRDREDAEDVAQVVMTRALARIRKDPPRKLRPWLMRVTRNESLMLLRSRIPREVLSPDVPAAGSVHGTFALREEVEGLVVDLRALPERQRVALVLRQLYELSYRDIGDLLGVRPGAARETVHQARVSLRTRAQGRAQDCGDIRLLLHDGRARRAVLVRAHLDACAACRAACQPSLAARVKGLLPLPEPVLPPLLLRLLSGPGAGLRGGGAAAACLCTFAIGLGIVGEVRRGDDGPPRSAGADRASVDSPAEEEPAAIVKRPAQRPAGRRRAATRNGSTMAPSRAPVSASGPAAAAPAPAQAVPGAQAASPPERPGREPGAPSGPRDDPEPAVELQLLNGAIVVYGPAPLALALIPPAPPQQPEPPLPAVPVPQLLPEAGSAALVGPLAR